MVTFFVAGKPAPAGSKRVGVVYRKQGSKRVPVTDAAGRPKTYATDMSGKAGKAWRAEVEKAAAKAMRGAPLMEGPLALEVTFRVARPKNHSRANGRLKDSAPVWPTTRPDTTKLLRAIEDAMTGVVWVDDSQVVDIGVRRLYADGQPGAQVEVQRLELVEVGELAESLPLVL